MVTTGGLENGIMRILTVDHIYFYGTGSKMEKSKVFSGETVPNSSSKSLMSIASIFTTWRSMLIFSSSKIFMKTRRRIPR